MYDGQVYRSMVLSWAIHGKERLLFLEWKRFWQVEICNGMTGEGRAVLLRWPNKHTWAGKNNQQLRGKTGWISEKLGLSRGCRKVIPYIVEVASRASQSRPSASPSILPSLTSGREPWKSPWREQEAFWSLKRSPAAAPQPRCRLRDPSTGIQKLFNTGCNYWSTQSSARSSASNCSRFWYRITKKVADITWKLRKVPWNVPYKEYHLYKFYLGWC